MKTILHMALCLCTLVFSALKVETTAAEQAQNMISCEKSDFFMTTLFPAICSSSRIYFSSLYGNQSDDSNEINTALYKQNCGCKNSHIIMSAKNTLLAGV